MTPHTRASRSKKLLDLSLSAIALAPILVVSGVVSIAIVLEDGGPVLFRQERIGKDAKTFTIYKFRSMKIDSPVLLTADGSTLLESDDHRVTNVGRVIRATSLDELPQVLNVIKGEMSWVGPRPSLVSALPTYTAEQRVKFTALPGISGYTQAFFRNSISNHEKRRLDAWYARNRTLALDLRILVRTVETVLRRENHVSR